MRLILPIEPLRKIRAKELLEKSTNIIGDNSALTAGRSKYDTNSTRNKIGIFLSEQSSTKWAPFRDVSEKSTPLLAIIPTGKPIIRAKPVTKVGA